jgi:hypothetical protein
MPKVVVSFQNVNGEMNLPLSQPTQNHAFLLKQTRKSTERSKGSAPP